MKVNYEHKKAMTFIGFSTTIRPDEGYVKCPDYECGIWVPVCRLNDKDEQDTAEVVSSMTITGIL